MTRCRVIRRRQARVDIEEATFWYARKAGLTIAGRFVDALETAMRHVAENPQSGSLRYADLRLEGRLRVWPVSGFPYLIFYVATAANVDVWRVLHGQRDVPRHLWGDMTSGEQGQ